MVKQSPLSLIAVVLLTGCTAISGLPAPDAQLRVTEGASSGGLALGGIEGTGDVCIVSVVGTLPPGLFFAYQGRACAVTYEREAPQ